ncbi:MAG TPA: histone H1 [Acidobacteria bacterium]|nr:histone H1 [Acidobacteriota bacterium]
MQNRSSTTEHPETPAKRPRDFNERAFQTVAILTGIAEPLPEEPEEPIRAAAALLGREGGLKGGKARSEKLSPERRAEIARKAALARWSKH